MTLCDEFIQNIQDNPERCGVTRYRFLVCGQSFWVASGFFFFRPESSMPADTFGFFERLRLWGAYRSWLKRCPAGHIGANT